MTCHTIQNLQDEVIQDLSTKYAVHVDSRSCQLDEDALDSNNADCYAVKHWGVCQHTSVWEFKENCSVFVFPFTPYVKDLDQRQKIRLGAYVDEAHDSGKCIVTLLEKSCSFTDLKRFHAILNMRKVLTVDKSNSDCAGYVSTIIRHLLSSHPTQNEATSWTGIWTDAFCELERLYSYCHASDCLLSNDNHHDRGCWTVYVQIGHGLLKLLFTYLDSLDLEETSDLKNTRDECKYENETLSNITLSVSNLGLLPGFQLANNIREMILKVYPHWVKMHGDLPPLHTDQPNELKECVHQLSSVCNMKSYTADDWVEVTTAAEAVRVSLEELLKTTRKGDRLHARLESLLPFVKFIAKSEANSFVVRSCNIYLKLLQTLCY